MNCGHCGAPLPAGSRRDRVYCGKNCSALASYYRRKAGLPTPPRWHHPALTSPEPLLHSAALHAAQLAEANGWSPTLLRFALDGLSTLLHQRPPGQRIPASELRALPRRVSLLRVTEVLNGLHLLECDDGASDRQWIEQAALASPPGFGADVRAWLLTLSQGGPRTRPRSRSTPHVYYSSAKPLLDRLAESRDHLREVTAADIDTVLKPLRGWQRRNAIAALRSLFRHAKKHGRIFTDPTTRLRTEEIPSSPLPLTPPEITAIEAEAATALHRLVIALTAIHAARPAAIRSLTLDDVDLAGCTSWSRSSRRGLPAGR